MALIQGQEYVFIVKYGPATASYETSEVFTVQKTMEEAEACIETAKKSEKLKHNYWLTAVPVGWVAESGYGAYDDLATLPYPAYRYSPFENTTVQIEK